MKNLNEARVFLGTNAGYDPEFYLHSFEKSLPDLVTSVTPEAIVVSGNVHLEFHLPHPVFLFNQKVQLSFSIEPEKVFLKYKFDPLSFIWVVLALFPVLALWPGQILGSLLWDLAVISVFLFLFYLLITHGHISAIVGKWRTTQLADEMNSKQNTISTRYQDTQMKYIYKPRK